MDIIAESLYCKSSILELISVTEDGFVWKHKNGQLEFVPEQKIRWIL